jgi:hypothetical protein
MTPSGIEPATFQLASTVPQPTVPLHAPHPHIVYIKKFTRYPPDINNILNGSIHNAELWQVSEQHVLSKDYILSFFNIYIIDLYLQNMCYL